jgi:hypothetical protein
MHLLWVLCVMLQRIEDILSQLSSPDLRWRTAVGCKIEEYSGAVASFSNSNDLLWLDSKFLYRQSRIRCAASLPNTSLALRLFFIIAHHDTSRRQVSCNPQTGRDSFRGRTSEGNMPAGEGRDSRFRQIVNINNGRRRCKKN